MTKILMPKGIKIDQAVALALLLEVFKAQFGDVEFFFHDFDGVPDGAYDLDAQEHYPRGTSATEVVAKRHGVAVGPLLEELSRNNATGFMRQGQESFALVAQKIYDLRASTAPAREYQIGVLSHFVKVGQAYLRASRAGKLGATRLADGFGFKPDASKRIHHLSGYISYLVEEGKADEAKAEFAWWSGKFRSAAAAAGRAEKRVGSLPEIIARQVGGLTVASVAADADEVAGKTFRRFQNLDILVVVSRDNLAVLPNFKAPEADLNRMKALHAALERREPGAWHLEPRGSTALVLNGSARRAASVPSKIGRDFDQMVAVMAEAWV